MSHKIDAALVQAFTDGAFGLSVAYENKKFEPVPGTPWSQLFIAPNQPFVNTMGDGGEDLITGFLQVNLNYPVGTGAGDAKQKATEIRDYFSAGTVFTYNGQDVFITNAGRGIARNIDSYYQVVITINWQARVQR
jgi:hypothetical protein